MSKNRLPPFVPLLISTLDAPAWRAMSHGARNLYVALRRRVPNGRNRAFLSYRHAQGELHCTPRQVSEWFKELEIALAQHGCLGVEGKGKSPHWRLTELGNTSRTSVDGLPEPPTRDFLRWDGTKFKNRDSRWNGYAEKNRIPLPRGKQCATAWEAPPLPRGKQSNPQVLPRGKHRERAQARLPGNTLTVRLAYRCNCYQPLG
jgi:hypothetical protein